MLLQGYLHSPIVRHGLLAEDLAKWTWSAEVCLFHFTDDILLTSDALTELEKPVPQVLSHLKSCGCAVNKAKLPGPGLSVKFLGVVWSGKTKVSPHTMIDKIQEYTNPTTVKQLQPFWGLLRYWRVHAASYSASLLVCLGKKGSKLRLIPGLGTSIPRNEVHH